MLLALARKDLYPDNPEKQKAMLEKYKDFIVSEEEADWFGLTLWKAEKKLMDYEDALPKPKPLKYQFLNDFIEELKRELLSFSSTASSIAANFRDLRGIVTF
ncbi:hypothetical protein HPB51_006306 [Rhipicephalus microplus]|uniref:Uncharacterized protein n=1 Tax=Rhipicephalus microplus TaxID=6941 RepID=A0A9J6EMH7_RHIMP|nr:hypothetical protein HPB51_006306 [Rhipicephalus microplus]